MKLRDAINKVFWWIKCEFFRSQKIFLIEGDFFYNARPTKVKNNVVAFNKNYVLKCEIFKHKRKLNNLKGEAKIIKYLNDHGCKCCPRLIKEGDLPFGRHYIILERIKKHGEYTKKDVVESIFEQGKIGVFHGDIVPDNIIFDGEKTMLIDYDQAILTPETKTMGREDYTRYFAKEMQKRNKKYFETYLNCSAQEYVDMVLEFCKDIR